MSRFIRAIRDTHSEPSGRLMADKWLRSGVIGVFFMEWPTPLVDGNIDLCFQGLSQTDAHPNLKELAAVCKSKGITIVACDLTVKDTVAALDAQNDGYGPYNETSAFQPWGKAVRDRNVAAVIKKHMDLNPGAWDRALLMFGSDHFKNEEGRNAPGLHMLIELQFGDGNITFLSKDDEPPH